jgi:hypothetical protein
MTEFDPLFCETSGAVAWSRQQWVCVTPAQAGVQGNTH